MSSDHVPAVVSSTEDRYVAHGLCKDEKAKPFDMGMEDSSCAADAADVSSQPSSPSSGGEGETTDVAVSPLRNATMIDEDVEDFPAATCVSTPPMRPNHQPRQMSLSSLAPPGCSRGLLGANIVVHPEQQQTRRVSVKVVETPQPSPSNHLPATTTSMISVASPTSRAAVLKTPSELNTSPTSGKVAATLPALPAYARTPSRALVEPMSALEVPLQPSPPSPVRSSTVPLPPVPAARDEEPDVCCICLEEYSVDNPMLRGECQHHFHLACLMEWKQRSNSCPMCCAETLRGVGEVPTPADTTPADSAEAARLREIAAQDEALAQQLQRKYLVRAQQRQRYAVRTTRASPTATPAESHEHNVPLLPPLTSVPWSAGRQASRGPPPNSMQNDDVVASEASAAVPAPATSNGVPTIGTGSSKKHKSRKINATAPAQASSSGTRRRFTPPDVHPQLQSGRQSHRRPNGGSCAMM
ncbi:hypothetical protein ABL78_7864 [Leptomonas seymouri]|uniref:RING-type E3 ubiquitin transferase n=1 Tax=Leptomonas seymouri TaxID=5684 RepID=A0A0N1HZY3_LEPSE|nr:hypothetical protein ABL78_7864 [Leptomonas seymouri]|eukprot:KPI83115.1 hypothetical protein ABL78_7864 [Leptomonas seymouri]